MVDERLQINRIGLGNNAKADCAAGLDEAARQSLLDAALHTGGTAAKPSRGSQ